MARFELSAIPWVDKTVGDEDTNPEPSFIGNTIQDVFFWRNRLGFLSGSRVIMSEADEFWNFWRITVRRLLDSAPIDLDAGHRKVANLKIAVPLEETLLIFTDRSQFVMRGDPILSPKTASILSTTEYESIADLEPIASEKGVYFGYSSGGGSFSKVDILQRVLDSDAFKANPVADQIPRYIKGKIIEMSATSLESVMAVRTDDDDFGNIIYIYKWLDRGQDRLLSSWMRFTVGPPKSSGIYQSRVLGM